MAEESIPQHRTLGPHLAIVETPHMTETRMLVLTRWGRFRAWIEDLASRAELNYPFPRVRRSETIPSAKVLVAGSRIYCHPETARRIRSKSETSAERYWKSLHEAGKKP